MTEGAEERDLARVLLNHITRKVVKQTVMTSVYGVTFVGARRQIAYALFALVRFVRDGVSSFLFVCTVLA